VNESLPVAERWWRSHDAGDGVTLLVERHITPMLESNVWHVRGRDADLVVDTANGIGPLRPVLDELAEGRPLIAVASHGHFDHVGGLAELDDRRCHEADAADTRNPFPVRIDRGAQPDGVEEMFAYYGFEVPDRTISSAPFEAFHAAAWVAPGAEPTSFVADGDVIDLGDRRFEVLHVPGHTPGSIALWEVETGLLFSGDTAYVDARLRFDDLEPAEESLRRLADLPVRRVHAGHDRSFDGDELKLLLGGLLADGLAGGPADGVAGVPASNT
jgi:glyoxylase-like metal-dependent hydrolase (beta-lactamase superfamily II)